MNTPKLFTPSSTDLNNMIAAAMRKCDADIEQSKLTREGRADARAEKMMVRQAAAIAAQRARRFWA